MKNTVYIDVDTERERPIVIGKGPENEPPTTKEEAREMVLIDIGCVCEALITLINIAEQSGYAKKEDLVINGKITSDWLFSMWLKDPDEVQTSGNSNAEEGQKYLKALQGFRDNLAGNKVETINTYIKNGPEPQN